MLGDYQKHNPTALTLLSDLRLFLTTGSVTEAGTTAKMLGAKMKQHPKSAELVYQAGGMETLFSLFSQTDPTLASAGAYALFSMAEQYLESTSSIVDHLESLINQAEVSPQVRCIAQAIFEAGAIEPLLGMMRQADPDIAHCPATALAVLIDQYPESTKDICKAGAIEALVAMIKQVDPNEVHHTAAILAASVLTSLMNRHPESAKSVCNSGGLEALLALVRQSIDPEAALLATTALFTIVKKSLESAKIMFTPENLHLFLTLTEQTSGVDLHVWTAKILRHILLANMGKELPAEFKSALLTLFLKKEYAPKVRSNLACALIFFLKDMGSNELEILKQSDIASILTVLLTDTFMPDHHKEHIRQALEILSPLAAAHSALCFAQTNAPTSASSTDTPALK